MQKKIKKTTNYHCGFISSKNRLENDEKGKKMKIIVPSHSNPMRNLKIQKNSKKIQEIKK